MIKRLSRWIRSTRWYQQRYLIPVHVRCVRSLFPHQDDEPGNPVPSFQFAGWRDAMNFAYSWVARYPYGKCWFYAPDDPWAEPPFDPELEEVR